MSKRLILSLAIAMLLVTSAAYAEVQNVKVSGDITIGGVFRNNFDLAKSPSNSEPTTINSLTYRDEEKDMFSITRVRVDADLTDNVAVAVRLLNERNWNGESAEGTGENNRNIGLNAANAVDEQDVDIDLAYVTLKEFLYSPLTLTVGRQELHFGNDWIIGDPDTNGFALRSALAEGDLSSRKAFDAVRATFDYNPLVLDIIYAKLGENNTVFNDDTTLYGLNAAYELNKNNTIEGFFFSKIKGTNAAAATNIDGATLTTLGEVVKDKGDIVHTVGARVVNKSVKNLTIDAQGAFQFGTYNPKFDPNARYDNAGVETDLTTAKVGNRRAWGLEVLAAYDLKDVSKIAKYNPMVSAGYIYLSGENRDRVGGGTYHGWDPMFENQTFGHIINAIFGFSNVTGYILTAQAKPMNDISMKLDYVRLWFNKQYPAVTNAVLSGVSTARQFTMGKTNYLGQEFDLTTTYDYTEDVQFSLLGGIFLPGKSINKTSTQGLVANENPMRAVATEVVGSMKVTF